MIQLVKKQSLFCCRFVRRYKHKTTLLRYVYDRCNKKGSNILLQRAERYNISAAVKNLEKIYKNLHRYGNFTDSYSIVQNFLRFLWLFSFSDFREL